MARILVVDDEPGILLILQGLLSRAGHDVETVDNGEAALRLLGEAHYDLLFTDLVMAELDGLGLIERVRCLHPDTAIIILTAHPSVDSAIRALHDEVDDYLVKPAGLDEIRRAVVRVLERRRARHEREAFLQRLALDVQQILGDPLPGLPRGARDSATILHIGPLNLDLDAHRVTWYGAVLNLTPTEFRLLVVLAENTGRVQSPQQLVEAVQEYRCAGVEARELIKPHILHLRAKLEPDPSRPRFLLTERGVGYCLRLEAADAGDA